MQIHGRMPNTYCSLVTNEREQSYEQRLGVDYSDHRNYWKFGFSAFMITDTSFFRNPNYHKETDTMETLDIPKMGQVVDGVFESLVKLK